MTATALLTTYKSKHDNSKAANMFRLFRTRNQNKFSNACKVKSVKFLYLLLNDINAHLEHISMPFFKFPLNNIRSQSISTRIYEI